jgi:uncharacterized protein YprB with RNaseH-like and TPR domain
MRRFHKGIEHLPSREHWRLFGAFRNSTAFFDIETTGLQTDWDTITTIALYDGRSIRTFVCREAFPGSDWKDDDAKVLTDPVYQKAGASAVGP